MRACAWRSRRLLNHASNVADFSTSIIADVILGLHLVNCGSRTISVKARGMEPAIGNSYPYISPPIDFSIDGKCVPGRVQDHVRKSPLSAVALCAHLLYAR